MRAFCGSFRREDPRAVSARALNLAASAGAFDDLVLLPDGSVGTGLEWWGARRDEVFARAIALVGRPEGRLGFRRTFRPVAIVQFWVDDLDGFGTPPEAA